VDLLRSRRAGLSLDDPELHCPEAADLSAEGDFDQVLLRADLGRAMSRLPAHYREPIELHLLGGLPQEEVSERLGRPRSTVASQIGRGLRRLERSLSGLLPGA
jgi:RNA polymerase sigma factor (sigma-70 family)